MKNQMNILMQAILFASCLFGLITQSPVTAHAQPSFNVTEASLYVADAKPSGKCPLKINFNGKITTDGPVTVKYTFLRSDGAIAPVYTLIFTAAGTKPVSTDWTLGDARLLARYEGWQKLKILSPRELETAVEDGKFVMNCAGATPGEKKADLIIEWAKLRLGTVCSPRSPVLYAIVKVKNIGTDASPARSDVGLVGAMDATGSGWGNGVGLPALRPGESHVATIPIYYLIGNPTYMPGRHEFEMQVNSGSWIEELNTSNNRYAPVSIEIPTDFCAPK